MCLYVQVEYGGGFQCESKKKMQKRKKESINKDILDSLSSNKIII